MLLAWGAVERFPFNDNMSVPFNEFLLIIRVFHDEYSFEFLLIIRVFHDEYSFEFLLII